jgi:hypothetical protein
MDGLKPITKIALLVSLRTAVLQLFQLGALPRYFVFTLMIHCVFGKNVEQMMI